MNKIIEQLRSLSFGGVVGSLLFSFLYLKYPELFPSGFSEKWAFVIGASLGGAIHRIINLFVVSFLRPLYGGVSFYLKAAQLILLQRFLGPEYVPRSLQREIMKTMTREFFLGKDGMNGELLEGSTGIKKHLMHAVRRVKKKSKRELSD